MELICPSIGLFLRIVARMSSQSSLLGSGTYKWRPSLSGLKIAVSIMSGQFVAPIKKRPSLLSNPFSSVNSWLTTRSITWLPSEDLFGHRPSISSKNIKQGVFYLALSKRSLMLFSLSPKYLFNNSGPLTYIKLALQALAIALASIVFPHPGGPYSRMPAVFWSWNF